MRSSSGVCGKNGRPLSLLSSLRVVKTSRVLRRFANRDTTRTTASNSAAAASTTPATTKTGSSSDPSLRRQPTCSGGSAGHPGPKWPGLYLAPIDSSAVHPSFEPWEVELHGHRVIYRTVGSGPPVVLIHGMVNSSRHWEAVALRLAEEYTVIAPDLIGHGDSATPRGDYSLGAHAAVIRDLLATLGIERATLVGHSLGGGIAMIFFYQ